MSEIKTKFEIVAKVVFGIALLCILYLFALNGRYSVSDRYVFDKWKMRTTRLDRY